MFTIKEGAIRKNYGSSVTPKVQGVHKCLFCVGVPKETEDICTNVCLPYIGRDAFSLRPGMWNGKLTQQ